MKNTTNYEPNWIQENDCDLYKGNKTKKTVFIFLFIALLAVMTKNIPALSYIGTIFSSYIDSQNIEPKVIANEPVIPYIPFYKIEADQFYKFQGQKSAFNKIELNNISDYTRPEFEKLVLNSLRPFLAKRLTFLISYIMKMSMKHNVDPFWALAVMGTESHYKTTAKSYVDAYGPMQIMPGTAHFISKLLKKSDNMKKSLKLRDNSFENIEMGVFYLGKLLKIFKGSHRLATTAYNMGPNGVRRRLRNNLEVGVRNNYLDKVRKFYKVLTKNYLKDLKIKKNKKLDASRHFDFPLFNFTKNKVVSTYTTLVFK